MTEKQFVKALKWIIIIAVIIFIKRSIVNKSNEVIVGAPYLTEYQIDEIISKYVSESPNSLPVLSNSLTQRLLDDKYFENGFLKSSFEFIMSFLHHDANFRKIKNEKQYVERELPILTTKDNAIYDFTIINSEGKEVKGQFVVYFVEGKQHLKIDLTNEDGSLNMELLEVLIDDSITEALIYYIVELSATGEYSADVNSEIVYGLQLEELAGYISHYALLLYAVEEYNLEEHKDMIEKYGTLDMSKELFQVKTFKYKY